MMSADDTSSNANTSSSGPSAAGDPVIRTEGVTKRFGGLVAVDDVDIEVREGEIVGLIGPNGAGKSTLFNCVTGALTPSEGSIYYRDQEVTDWPEHKIASEGLVRMFQHTRVYGDMTVIDNMLVSAAEDTGLDRILLPPSDEARERAEELLRYIGLWGLKDTRAGRMSFGQQKLLEFGMALMADPDVLLMDEPAGGINPSMLQQLMDYIRDANTESSVTIFLIEHNMDFVMEVSDRIYALAHGEKIADGTPEEIQNDERVLDAYLGRE